MERKRIWRTVWIVVLVLIVLALLVFFDVPRRLGLVKGAGARFTDLTHERIPADEIKTEAEAKGLTSEGVDVYVFPKPDSGEAVVFAEFDFSKGAALSAGPYSPLVSTLVLLGGGEKAKEHGITDGGAAFLDEEGQPVASVVAKISDIHDLQAGKISEEIFLNERLKKDIRYPRVIRRSIPF